MSVINVKDVKPLDSNVWAKFAAHFYSVSIKRDVKVKVKYGQQYYDFDKGVMSFLLPNRCKRSSSMI